MSTGGGKGSNYEDLLLHETEKLVKKYKNREDEPIESYLEGQLLAALALKSFDSPIKSLLFFEEMAEGKSAAEAIKNLDTQWSSKKEEQIRKEMRDTSMWTYMETATALSNQIGIKNDKMIRGFFTVNTLNSLESGLELGVQGVRKIPRFLYLRPPLI